MQKLLLVLIGLVGFSAVGCGPDDSVTVAPVDDSVVHSEEEMEQMAEQNASDMRSQ